MPSTIERPAPARGRAYDRREFLRQLADGDQPEVVYGAAREAAASEAAGYLRGIRLDDGEVLLHALRPTERLERRYRAYRAGVRFLHDAYYEYGLTTGRMGTSADHTPQGDHETKGAADQP